MTAQPITGRVLSDSSTDMALADFNGRCVYRIKPDNVDATLTDFPLLLTRKNLPAAIFGHAKSDGGDIRATSDKDGSTSLPVEVVSFDATNKTAEIWVSRTLSSTDYTEFTLWYGNPAASTPAVDSTYGSQAVWGDFDSVLHHNDDLNDSSSNALDYTEDGSTSFTEDLWGNDSGASTSDTYHGSRGGMNFESYSISQSWIVYATGTAPVSLFRGDFGAEPRFYTPWKATTSLVTWGKPSDYGNGEPNGVLTTRNKWVHVALAVNHAGSCKIYIDGVGSSTSSSIFSKACQSGTLRLGSDNLVMAESRYQKDKVQTDAWYKAEYHLMIQPEKNIIPYIDLLSGAQV